MFTKTSSPEFLRYGEVFSLSENGLGKHEQNYHLTISNKKVTYMFEANQDVYFKIVKGTALLLVTKRLDQKIEEFVVHRVVRINRGVLFNFVSLEKEAIIEINFAKNMQIIDHFLPEEYSYQRIMPKLNVKELIAFYYSLRSPHYIFAGEKNDLWEITYVDDGILHTTIDDNDYVLHGDQLILYGPEQFHKQSTENESSSYLTIMFDLDIVPEYSKILLNRVFTVNREIKKALQAFVALDNDASSFSSQSMLNIIGRILMCLLHSTEDHSIHAPVTQLQQKFENELLNQIILYINENIYFPFSVEDICEHFAISRSTLQSLFNNNLHVPPKEYTSSLKLLKSKQLIKENKYTISEIADILGFNSVHYFSHRFKQKFNLTPSEYANKIIK